MDPSYLHYTFIKCIFIERWITPSRKMWNGKEDKTIFHFRFIVPTGKNHSKIQHFRFIDLSSKIHHEWSEWQCIGSHSSHNGPINFIFRPDCYIFKDASLDTHIDTIYVRHLSSVIADIFRLCQMSDVSDDRWRT